MRGNQCEADVSFKCWFQMEPELWFLQIRSLLCTVQDLEFPAALCYLTSQTLLIYWTNRKRQCFPGEEGRQWIPSWPLQLLILCRETWNLITLIISLAHIATNVISSHKIIEALLKSIFKECVTCISRSETLISNTLTGTSETKCRAKQQWQGLRCANEEWCHCLRETLHIINTLAH